MKFLIFFIVSLVITGFIFGVGVGHYEFFPFSDIKNLKLLLFQQTPNHETDFLIYDTDVDSLISIYTIDDVLDKRQELINFIWKNKLPDLNNLTVTDNVTDLRYEDISNLQSIHKYEIMMDNEVNSIAYHFIPNNMNSDLIIYHQGHAGDFYEGIDTIKFFVEKGYSVLAFSMPLSGMNNQPIFYSNDFGNIKLTSHNQFIFLESESFSPIQYFVEPIWVSLDYIDQNFIFDSYNLVGISGGGWTATLYAAIDPRVDQSFSIAGSLPFFMQSETKNFGDYEQNYIELYKIGNYLELYLLGSADDDRKFIQIFNKNDPCCFSGDPRGYYDVIIQNRLSQFSTGQFDIFVDSTHSNHIISDYSRSLILEHLTSKQI